MVTKINTKINKYKRAVHDIVQSLRTARKALTTGHSIET
jgi:hypothetical protein